MKERRWLLDRRTVYTRRVEGSQIERFRAGTSWMLAIFGRSRRGVLLGSERICGFSWVPVDWNVGRRWNHSM